MTLKYTHLDNIYLLHEINIMTILDEDNWAGEGKGRNVCCIDSNTYFYIYSSESWDVWIQRMYVKNRGGGKSAM